MDWIELAIAAVGGFSGAAFYRFMQGRNDCRYKWDCTESTCTFHVATNNEKVLEAVKVSHTHHHALRKGALE